MIETNIKNLNNELLDIVKIFYPVNFEAIDIKHVFGGDDGNYIDFFNICGIEYSIKHESAEYYAKHSNFGVLKKIVKSDLYTIMSRITGKTSLWGSLTGIRPVKLYKDTLIEFGVRTDEFFTNFFSVSREKLVLIKDIANIQQKLPAAAENDCDLYIGIPFCNGRCSYCSFVSADISKNAGIVEPYADALVKEIAALKEMIISKGYKVRAIYIGGGTPSSFSVKNLENIFKALEGLKFTEHTFEAGRPDSVTKELLNLLAERGVNRISINPQTANDGTLKLIGRNHTFKDILNAYNLTRKYNFSINMDVIAGLAGETFDDFKNTLDSVIKLSPDNITVHTLCLKKGSIAKIDLENEKKIFKKINVVPEILENLETDGIKEKNSLIAVRGIGIKGDSEDNKEVYKLRQENAGRCNYSELVLEGVSKMLNYAHITLKKSGYEPYYLYRQKYSFNNLENVGYCKKGKACLYNIDNMDDALSIMACGANGISKRVYPDNKIERYANPKDVKTYIEKIEAINLMKNRLFE